MKGAAMGLLRIARTPSPVVAPDFSVQDAVGATFTFSAATAEFWSFSPSATSWRRKCTS